MYTYKGFYCSLCDSRSHRFIDLIDKKIIYSKSFCRKMLQESYHVIEYFGVQFDKFMNLSMSFLTQCNYKGKYRELEFSDILTFKYNADLDKKLTLCRDKRNSVNWIDSCIGICQKFRIDKFQPFWHPRLKNLVQFVQYSRRRLIKILKDKKSKLPIIPRIRHKDTLAFRILQE